MIDKKFLFGEIEKLPPHILQEVYNFVQHIKQNSEHDEKNEMLIAAESSLKDDWLKPEEDEAWQNL